ARDGVVLGEPLRPGAGAQRCQAQNCGTAFHAAIRLTCEGAWASKSNQQEITMMINANKIISISALLAVLFLSSIARAEEWKHEFTPYAWMSDLKTTAGGANVSATSDIDFFDDLLPLVDAGWMHMYEARQNNLSLMNEVVYMKISEGVSDSGPLGFVSTSVKGVYEQGLVDLFGGYTPNHGNTIFFGGLRYIFLDVDVDASVSVIPPGTVVKASGQRDEHWVDPVIGVRHIIPLTDK